MWRRRKHQNRAEGDALLMVSFSAAGLLATAAMLVADDLSDPLGHTLAAARFPARDFPPETMLKAEASRVRLDIARTTEGKLSPRAAELVAQLDGLAAELAENPAMVSAACVNRLRHLQSELDLIGGYTTDLYTFLRG